MNNLCGGTIKFLSKSIIYEFHLLITQGVITENYCIEYLLIFFSLILKIVFLPHDLTITCYAFNPPDYHHSHVNRNAIFFKKVMLKLQLVEIQQFNMFNNNM